MAADPESPERARQSPGAVSDVPDLGDGLSSRRSCSPDPGKGRLRRRMLLAGGLFLLLPLLWHPGDDLTFMGWRIMVDFQDHACIPGAGIFLVDTADRSPERGALFAFRSRGGGFFPGDQIMIKHMAGLPGDRIQVTAAETRVGDQIVARGLGAAVYAGADPALFVRSLTLGEDEFFMLGESERSLDSRYWGNVHAKDLVGRAYLVYQRSAGAASAP